MRAIIMAAGRATRMLPLAKDIPKCLLKVKGKSILQHQIDVLNKNGIKDVLIITGYRSEKIEKLYGKKLKYVFNPFYKVSGMIMSLWEAKDELEGDMIIMYSDVLFNENIIKKLLDCKGDVSLVIDRSSVDMEAEKVKIRGSSVIKTSKTSIAVENADGEFIGLMKVRRGVNKVFAEELEKIAKTNINAYLIDLIQNIIDRKVSVMGCDITGEVWIDIDFPEDLEKAKKLNL